jgi:uncharacterized repeat protein (TIGR02543 family)
MTAEAGIPVTVSGNTGSLTKAGYVFTGWNTTADGTGTDYFAGSALTLTAGSVTLYAQWAKKQIVFKPSDWPILDTNYNVAYSTSDGKNTIVPTSYYYAPSHAVLYKTPVEGTYAAKHNFIGFNDIIDTYWAREFVWYLSARTVINGVAKETFAPETEMTRSAFVKMLVCLTPGLELDSVEPVTFTDVSAGDWFTPYISWAVTNHIAAGYEDGSFHPTTPITREDMCQMIFNYTAFIGYDLGVVNEPVVFSDQDEIRPSTAAAVSALQQSGLVTGNGDQFNPKDYSTRAVAATIACRLLMGIQSAMENPSVIPLG